LTASPWYEPGKKEVRILYAAQTGVCPPQFVLFTNVATKLHFSYERFLVNRLRDAFGPGDADSAAGPPTQSKDQQARLTVGDRGPTAIPRTNREAAPR
jgi:hypothetical protein